MSFSWFQNLFLIFQFLFLFSFFCVIMDTGGGWLSLKPVFYLENFIVMLKINKLIVTVTSFISSIFLFFLAITTFFTSFLDIIILYFILKVKTFFIKYFIFFLNLIWFSLMLQLFLDHFLFYTFQKFLLTFHSRL